MTREQIVAWYQETGAMLQTCTQLRDACSKTKGLLDLAEAAGDSNQFMTMTEQLRQRQETLEKMTLAVVSRCKSGDLSGSERMWQDLGYKLEQAEAIYEQWRKLHVKYELFMSQEAVRDSITSEQRAEVSTELSRLSAQYDAAIALCSEHIPSSVRLLHV